MSDKKKKQTGSSVLSPDSPYLRDLRKTDLTNTNIDSKEARLRQLKAAYKQVFGFKPAGMSTEEIEKVFKKKGHSYR